MKDERVLYTQPQQGRGESKLKHRFWDVFLPFASMGRMLIEVFIRKDFGERYFRLYQAVRASFLLAVFPFVHWLILQLLMVPSFALAIAREHEGMGTADPEQFQTESIFPHYITWYLYLLVFLYVSVQHHKAMKRNPSVFDFARYSLDRGRIHKVFREFEFRGKKGDYRLIECWLEPAPFFAAGLLLAVMGQYLGWLLILSSIAYSISYFSAYNWGDNYVMSMIDKKIVSEELEETFLNDSDGSQTRGYRFLGRKPEDPTMRKAVLDLMQEDEDDGLLAQ